MPAALPSTMSLWYVRDEHSKERPLDLAAIAAGYAAVPQAAVPAKHLSAVTTVDARVGGRTPTGFLQQPTILGWFMREEEPEAPAPADTKEICGICLDVPDMPVELGCSHAFCSRCLMTAHDKHHNRCPVCRHEHMLDPIALRDKMVAYRAAYGVWRKGGVKGAHGEPDIIGKVAITAAPISPRKSKDQLQPRLKEQSLEVPQHLNRLAAVQ